eukprot:g2752.t1
METKSFDVDDSPFLARIKTKSHRTSSSNTLWKPPKPTDEQRRRAVAQNRKGSYEFLHTYKIRVPDVPKDVYPISVAITKDKNGKIGITFDEELNIVQTDSWAEQFGAEVGMKVIACSGKRVHSMQDMIAISKQQAANKTYLMELECIRAPTATTLKRAKSLMLLMSAVEKRKRRLSEMQNEASKRPPSPFTMSPSSVAVVRAAYDDDGDDNGSNKEDDMERPPPPPPYVYEDDHPMWIFASDLFKSRALERTSTEQNTPPTPPVRRRRSSSTAAKMEKREVRKDFIHVLRAVQDQFSYPVRDPRNVARMKQLARARGEVLPSGMPKVAQPSAALYTPHHPVWTFADDVIRSRSRSDSFRVQDEIIRTNDMIEAQFGVRITDEKNLKRLSDAVKSSSSDFDRASSPPPSSVPTKKRRQLKTKCSFSNLAMDLEEALDESAVASPTAASNGKGGRRKQRRMSLFSAISTAVSGTSKSASKTTPSPKKEDTGRRKKPRRMSLFSALNSAISAPDSSPKPREYSINYGSIFEIDDFTAVHLLDDEVENSNDAVKPAHEIPPASSASPVRKTEIRHAHAYVMDVQQTTHLEDCVERLMMPSSSAIRNAPHLRRDSTASVSSQRMSPTNAETAVRVATPHSLDDNLVKRLDDEDISVLLGLEHYHGHDRRAFSRTKTPDRALRFDSSRRAKRSTPLARTSLQDSATSLRALPVAASTAIERAEPPTVSSSPSIPPMLTCYRLSAASDDVDIVDIDKARASPSRPHRGRIDSALAFVDAVRDRNVSFTDDDDDGREDTDEEENALLYDELIAEREALLRTFERLRCDMDRLHSKIKGIERARKIYETHSDSTNTPASFPTLCLSSARDDTSSLRKIVDNGEISDDRAATVMGGYKILKLQRQNSNLRSTIESVRSRNAELTHYARMHMQSFRHYTMMHIRKSNRRGGRKEGT